MKTNLGIYIHIPFCLKKCDYCDFYSVTNTELQDKYINSLINEIDFNSIEISKKSISSIYFGGGTPSLLTVDNINRILNKLYEFDVLDNIEITLECNPETLNFEYLQKLKTTKINRLSIGMQSLNNDILKQIGRIHNREKFLEVFNLAREVGFHNINIDIMFGFYRQTFSDFKDTLKEVITINPTHISCYSLILEEGTKLFDEVRSGKHDEVDENTLVEMYEFMVEFLDKNNYKRYEISNFSKAGYEAKHNISYWKNVEYIGIGASASSYINFTRYKNKNDINLYINNNGINCNEQKEFLTKNDLISEFFFLGLRMDKGVSYTEFFNNFGVQIEDLFKKEIDKFIQEGLLIKDGDIIRLTKAGVNLSNYVFEAFII